MRTIQLLGAEMIDDRGFKPVYHDCSSDYRQKYADIFPGWKLANQT